MKVLVVNCGSSSVKFQLVETDAESARAGTDRALAKGLVENVGGTAVLKFEVPGRKAVKETAEILEHKVAVERILDFLTHGENGVLRDRREIGAVGHRVVHGGSSLRMKSPTPSPGSSAIRSASNQSLARLGAACSGRKA